jgi:hypothetical protein
MSRTIVLLMALAPISLLLASCHPDISHQNSNDDTPNVGVMDRVPTYGFKAR